MDDLISRQAVIEALDFFDWHDKDHFKKFLLTAPLPSKPQWIPCSERLPDEKGLYLVTVRAEFRPVRIYGFSPWDLDEMKKYWINDCNDHSHVFNHFVEAWMPLPEGYKGDDRNG